MTKKILTISALVFFLLPLGTLQAQETNAAKETNVVNIYFFRGEGCPHCAKEEIFLEDLKNRYPNILVHDFEVWKSSENRKILAEVGRALGSSVSGVPLTVIGDKVFIGFSEGLISEEMENRVQYCSVNICPDSVGAIAGIGGNGPGDPSSSDGKAQQEEKSVIPEKITFPLIGEIKTKNLSLPIFTVVLGALDGFNPCAMWTLLFLISLLLGMENKRRMWILGGTFIAASAFVYFIFMAAWLNLLLFIGFIVWVRIIIGLIAIAGGSYNLKEYFTNPQPVCQVAGSEKKQKILEKLKAAAQQKKFYLALGGIILLAFAVNLIELICSAGLPAIYTQVLTLSNLSPWQYYLYLLLYIFIFMLDDMIVFFIAMKTLKMTRMTAKYSKFSHLVGGIIMLIIGALLILKPELLMFG